MFKYFLVLLALFFCKCASSFRNDIDQCKLLNEKSAEFLDNFYYYNDTSYLDSALNVINKALDNCEEYDVLLSYRKLGILSLTHEYQQALLFIETFDSNKFNQFSYSKNVLYKRFQAMQAQYVGNIIERNNYLNSIIKELENFLVLNEQKVDSVFMTSNTEDILKDLGIAIMQYYYYRSILEGKDVVSKELDLKQVEKGQNEDVVNIIKDVFQEDFMIFIGF